VLVLVVVLVLEEPRAEHEDDVEAAVPVSCPTPPKVLTLSFRRLECMKS
jgi:hypothetical protein